MSVNYFPIQLPSKGKLNPDVNFNEIQIRPLTGGDEMLLAESSQSNAFQRIIEVIGNTLKGVDIKQLSIGDELSIMVWHAINSYGDGFHTQIFCENCLKKITIEYRLAELETITLDDSFQEPIPVRLRDGSVIHCRLLRVKDTLDIAQYEKDVPNSYLYKLAITIVDSQKNIVERMKMLSEMIVADVAKIRAVQDKYYHGPDFRIRYKCPLCQAEGFTEVPFRLEEVFSYRDSASKTSGNEI